MARKIIQQVTYFDDLDGTELAEGEVVSVSFGWDGVQYEIDLSQANAAKIEKAIKPYVEKARRVRGGRGRPRGTGTRADTGSGRSKEELANIRDWLKRNGHEVSPRGRIKAELLDLYDQAHAPSS